MATNLLVAAGLAYVLTGVLLLCLHLRPRVIKARRALAYPSVLAKRSARRLDSRVGAGFSVVGSLALTAGAHYGYAAPMSLWRYPAAVAVAVLAAYLVARVLVMRPVHRAKGPVRRGFFESRRALTLRVAAEREAAALHARELAAAPKDTGVVYLRKHWERSWWSDKLGASAEAIEAAIERVGPMSHDVRRHLSQRAAA